MKSFIHALRGIWAAVKSEPHMRFHLISSLLVIIAGFFFHVEPSDWMALIFSMGLVITAELINSAIEDMVNLVSPEIQPLAGRIKDMAAGAVLVSAITAAVIGVMVFWKYID